jgi:hypothetical protein
MKGFSLRDTLLVMAVCLLFAGVGLGFCIWLGTGLHAAWETLMQRQVRAPQSLRVAIVVVSVFLLACAATAACFFGVGYTYYLYRKSQRE